MTTCLGAGRVSLLRLCFPLGCTTRAAILLFMLLGYHLSAQSPLPLVVFGTHAAYQDQQAGNAQAPATQSEASTKPSPEPPDRWKRLPTPDNHLTVQSARKRSV